MVERVVLLAGGWVAIEVLRAAGLGWSVVLPVALTVGVLAWLALREVAWGLALGGLLLGTSLLSMLICVSPVVSDCLRPVPWDSPLWYCSDELAHPAMKLGALVGGVVGLAALPVVVRWRQARRPALDAADDARLVAGAWLGVLASVHLGFVRGWVGWAALFGACALLVGPTLAAWRGTSWVRALYAGRVPDYAIDAHPGAAYEVLPCFVAGQAEWATDAVLLRLPRLTDPYRGSAAPRQIARVCSSLQSQLAPLRRRSWLGTFAVVGLTAVGTWASLAEPLPLPLRVDSGRLAPSGASLDLGRAANLELGRAANTQGAATFSRSEREPRTRAVQP